jgi:cell division protease FtsH
VDEEIRRIVDESYEKARRILTENIDQLHTLAKGLLEYETLSGEDINRLLRGDSIIRDDERESYSAAPPRQPTSGRRSSVPTSGKESSGGGMGPEPQGT